MYRRKEDKMKNIFYGNFKKMSENASKMEKEHSAVGDILIAGAVCAVAAAPFLCGSSIPAAAACTVLAGLAGIEAYECKKEANRYAKRAKTYEKLHWDQEAEKERRNSGNNREKMRSEIREYKKELEELKKTEATSVKKIEEKNEQIEKLESNIAKNSQILRESCASRKEQAKKYLQLRKEQHQRS